jgi:triacylglycerol lipase
MTTRHLVDPELLAGLDVLPSFTYSREILAIIREQLAQMTDIRAAEIAIDVHVREERIAAPEGHTLDVIVLTPKTASTAPRPAVLHAHGGGYILGSAKSMIAGVQRMAIDADCVVVSVDYRLAPETPHPGPVEDCYAALKWLHANAASLNVDANRIAVAGESAGGGLAAALALLARDRGEIAILHQHLIYPMIDDRTCVRATSPHIGEFVWSRESNHFGWSALLGCAPGGADISPYAAAARAETLAGLPSTFISVGALDLFVEEDVIYAQRLLAAGVPTELHVYPGAYHGFDLAADAAVTRRAQQTSLTALRRALHPT